MSSLAESVHVAGPEPVRIGRPWWLTRTGAVPVVAVLAVVLSVLLPVRPWVPSATLARRVAAGLGQHAAGIAVPVLLFAVVLSARVASETVRRRAVAVAGAVLAVVVTPPVVVGMFAAFAAAQWLKPSERTADRRRVAAIRSGWPSVAELAGVPESRAIGARRTAAGWTVTVRTVRGHAADALARRTRDIAAALRRGDVAVTVHTADARVASVRVAEGPGPWAGPSAELPEPATRTVSAGAVVGTDADGRPVTVPIVQSSLLVGGRPGSGKSVMLASVIAAAVAADDAEVFGIDLKAGVELAPWAPVLKSIAPDAVAAAAVLGRIEAVMADRLATLAAIGARVHNPTPHEPQLVVVVDELAELDKDAMATVRRILALGRAAGITVVAATQRPSADLIPTSVRALFRFAGGLQTARRSDSDIILGNGWNAENVSCADLPAPGHAWLVGDGRPVRLRTFAVPDDRIRRAVKNRQTVGPEPANRHTEPLEPQPYDRTEPEPELAGFGKGAADIVDALRAGPMRANAVADRCRLSERHVRKVLPRLQEAGHVERVAAGWQVRS